MKLEMLEYLLIQLNFQENKLKWKHTLFYVILSQILSIFFLIYPFISNRGRQNQFESIMEIPKVILLEFLEQVYVAEYSVLIMNAWIIILLISLCFENQKQKITQMKTFETKQLQSIPIYYLMLTSKIINYMLLQPLLCLGLFNLYTNFQSNQINLYYIIQNLVFLLFVHVFSISYYILNNTTLLLTDKMDKKIEDDYLDFIIYILRILQSYIFILFDSPITLYFQGVIYLSISIIRIYTILIQMKYCDFNHCFILLFFSSSGLIMSICIFGEQNFNLGYLMLLNPLLIFCLWNILSYQIEFIIVNDPQKLSIDMLHFLVCFIFADNQFSKQKNCLLNGIKFSKHIKYCQSVNCSCQNKYNAMDPLELNLIQLDIFQSFQNSIVQQFRQLNLHKKGKHFYKMCHLLSALHQLGYHQEIYYRIEDQKYKYLLTFVQQINWIVFTFIIKKQMYNKFAQQLETDNKECLELSAKITAFLHSESFHLQIRNNLISLIKLKIQILSSLLILNNDELYEYIETFALESIKRENELKQIFLRFPSSKNQSILMFFMGEIVNDWYRAYEFCNFNSFDNNTYQQFISSDINSISNKMTYLVFVYENKKLYLQGISKKACEIFGWDQEQFSQLKDANVLLPYCIRDTHDQEIDKFLQTGKGLYFRTKGINFCQCKTGYLQPIHFFYDIQFDQQSFFQFISFIQKLETHLGILIVDENTKIQGISKDFFKMMNFSQLLIDSIQIEKLLYGLSSSLFFSLSQFTIESTTKSVITFPNEELCLLMQSQSLSQKINLCKQRHSFNLFEVQGDIQIRNSYSIIRIYRMMECEASIQTQKQIEYYNSGEFPSIINDEDAVISPYDECFQFFSPLNENQQNQSNQYFLRSTQKQITKKIQLIESNIQNSISQLVENEQQTIKMLGNIYQNEQEDDTVSFQQDAQSNASYEQLRKSHFYKKYCLYYTIINSDSIQPHILKSTINLFMVLFIILIFIILFSILKAFDLQKVILYYDQIQINHFFIEPIHKFYLARFTVQDYFYLRYLNQISEAENQFYQSFSIANIIREYSIMRLNFQEHFQEQKFQEFLFNQYMNVKQQTIHYIPISTQVYNITVQSAFAQLLDAFYKQELIYLQSFNVNILGVAPHQTFQYLNYIQFITIFDDISNQIQQQFLNQMKATENLWLFLCFPTQLISTFFLLGSFLYIRHLKRIIDKFINLRSFTDLQSVSKDLKRLSFLINHLKSDSDMIYKYRFNLNAKESIIMENMRGKNNVKDETLYNKQTPIIKLIQIYFLIFIVCAGIIMTLTLIITSFYQLFPKTFNYFKLFSDVGVYVPAAFSQKEILYFWNRFQFFTSEDRVQFMEQVSIGIEKINKFISTDVYADELQFSNDFLNYYQYIGSNNICPLLNKSNYVEFDYFCENSKSGILKRGLLPTLSDFNYQLKYELDNGLINRTIIPMEELEAVYLCSEVISSLCDQMLQDIVDQINKLDNILNWILTSSFILIVLGCLIVYLRVYPRMKNKLKYVKKITQIFPQDSIFLNDYLERDIRKIILIEQIN
ncbi:unnamed protein product [Paramecium pentaurelia]|uniref:PAS domain-containing protein n=1 Tax=Paramecium pentaurelia TaxID=43138 RepID=A0A8S1VHW0_9CILI|nr:unnamed protein product [Paramecium pentaurelia]